MAAGSGTVKPDSNEVMNPILERLERQLTYLRSVQEITNEINSAPDVDAILVDLRARILSLFEADRITIYVVDTRNREIWSHFKVGHEVNRIRMPLDNTSLAGHTAVTGRTTSIRDAYDEKEVRSLHDALRFDKRWDRRTGFRTSQILTVPIQHKQEVLGVLQLINRSDGEPFGREDQRSAGEIARILAAAIHKSRLETQLAYHLALQQITNRIHSARDLDSILIDLKDSILSLFEAERLTIYVLDEGEKELWSRFKVGHEVAEIRIPLDNTSLAAHTARGGSTTNVYDAYDSREIESIHPGLRFDRKWDERTGFRTSQILTVPIAFEGRTLGVLQLVNRKNRIRFSGADEEGAREMGDILGIAFRNQRRMTPSSTGRHP